MRPAFVSSLLLALALAGCTTNAPEVTHTGWTFTTRIADEPPAPLGEAESFEASRELLANASARQIGGRWHGGLRAGEPFTLTFEASVDMLVEFRVRDASGATSSGTCNWAPDERQEKDVGIGRARLRSTNTTCEILFTPHIDVGGEEPTLRWEARSREANASDWSLRFTATRR